SLTPMGSGPYTGIVIFQARDNARTLTISGNGLAGLKGTIYASAAPASLSGNGQLQAMFVVGTLTITGNGASTLTTDESFGVSNPAGQLLMGHFGLYVDNHAGIFTAEELSQVADGVVAINAVVLPYGTSLTEVGDAGAATVILKLAAGSV